ncbi:MAG: hypothetical protein J6W52_08550 [Bacteroidaceae bacterium]|nr:hypothetical protein [Bacteroidaceae bacterium]
MKCRGLRNCNPLNIRRVAGTHWKGQILPLKGAGGSFCKFESMEWGIRAAFCLLRTYRNNYKLNCIRDIITRWAPPSENDTERYIKNVCLWTGFGGLQRLTEEDWPALVRAMARQECGVTLSEEIINRGYKLYKNTNI